MSAVEFAISRWSAWAPGLPDAAAWRRWARDGYIDPAAATVPELGFLPALQRRRLSPAARLACAAAWAVLDEGEQLPMLYASRHGEALRTVEIFTQLARAEPLSPTTFGLSVHNAVIGQISILRGDRSEMNAIAAAGDSLEHALLEAAALLAEQSSDVLVLVGDARVPEAYRGYVDDVAFDHAFALRLSLAGPIRLRLELGECGERDATAASDPLHLVRALELECPAWSTQCGRRHWRWTRQ